MIMILFIEDGILCVNFFPFLFFFTHVWRDTSGYVCRNLLSLLEEGKPGIEVV